MARKTQCDEDLLTMMGSGESIEDIRQKAGFSGEQFHQWWRQQLESRLPRLAGIAGADVEGRTEILRDRWGIPHVLATSDHDLFFAYGYAMAQDRLWQLDYFRRQAHGRLAEIMGADARPRATGNTVSALERDTIARTVGFRRIAASTVERLPRQTLLRLQSFADGINTAMETSAGRLPIEFALLAYEPDPWTPLDSIAVWVEFQYYLTVRLPVIALPEIARRTLGDGPLYDAFLTAEAANESILPPGSYPASRSSVEGLGQVVGDPEEALGSNNWVVAGGRSASGNPMIASDPHIAFNAVSCWYEAHLSGAGFNVAGAGYIGVPGVILGRNERVAWGLTNNICSQRDLYQEKTDPDYPGQFLYNGQWEPAREAVERIQVKNGDPVGLTIRFSRNGPIVDDLLPAPARDTGPVSLRWLGATFCDEVTSLLDANCAKTCDEFRKALSPWRVPTVSFVFADVDGHIGYQCLGRIPIREGWRRGYRRGWDPGDQWQGLIPFDGMPALSDPPQDWIRTANNRTAPEDYPYPLSGTWATGYRARRIRQLIEAEPKLSREDFARMQMDTYSIRAEESIPGLLELLGDVDDADVQAALDLLRSWNYRMDPEQVGAAVFEVFFGKWTHAVASQRFQDDLVSPMAGAIAGLCAELLSQDQSGWFAAGERREVALAALKESLEELRNRLGSDMSGWTWGHIHTVALAHCLSNFGDLGKLLDQGGQPVGGSGITVCNTGYDPTYMAAMGANYRLVAEVDDGPAVLWSVDASGQSGNPGSRNYGDQLPEWLASRRHALPLDRAQAESDSASRLIFEPSG